MSYATRTGVSIEQSIQEIRKILMRFGAKHFGCMEMEEKAAIMFFCRERHIKFVLPLPKKFNDQKKKSMWRSLVLAIKSKLVNVENGIATFETEFMPYIVMPDQRTAAEWVLPQIEGAYRSGIMPNPIAGLLEPPKKENADGE